MKEDKKCQWRVARRPDGNVVRDGFQYLETDIPRPDDGEFLLDEFEKLITAKTKIVAVTHMSNALGTITPVQDIIRIAHAHGIPVLIDGSRLVTGTYMVQIVGEQFVETQTITLIK